MNGSGNIRELNIEALTSNLQQVLDHVDACLEEADCPVKVQMQIDVAVEEIFVNIASYAYAPGTGDASVGVEILEDPHRVEITFADKGMPYDPLSREDPDVTLSAGERPIGGLGIFMTKKMMDDVTYENRDGSNILKLVKNL
ncbi:MAG: ATP-binding protein [Lachnospiraceae bacterium]|nr:ATP-binding protein [Lachnospiraceae bacterium]